MFSWKLENRKIIALVDYKNVARNATEKGKIVDFKKLHELLLEFGEIFLAFVFIPDNYVCSLPNDLNNLGFEVIFCQKMTEGSDKLEDTVDINMIQIGTRFCYFSEITDIVIVGHDKHMAHLIKEAKNRKKKVSIIGTEKISNILRKIVDMENVYNLPLK
ncbi:MAG: NYN domain-containing protein [Candidatus Paceibacterota bacterium]